MQVAAGSVLREHEKPMSWARAIAIATGFFFVAGLFLGQVPSYVYTVATLSTMTLLEQGFLSLGLLALGMGLISLEISFLYDPRPLIPWPLFALVGAGIAAVGAFLLLMVYVSPHATIPGLGISGWPQAIPDTGYLLAPIWLQAGSIDLAGVGLAALITGLGMFTFAVLNPWVLSGRAFGPTRDLAVRFLLGLAIVLAGLYFSIVTFAPVAFAPQFVIVNPQAQPPTTTITGAPYAFGNILLFLALCAALLALVVWLLPVMTANRQQFMPAVYFHGVISLIGLVAVPLLLVWLLVYPILYGIHQIDPGEVWVQCALKTSIPASCSFTQFTGYIICAAVFGGLFTFLIAGIYFWSTRRNTVVLGATYAIVFLGLAFVVIHTSYQSTLPLQVPSSLLVAVGIIVLALIFTWASQREFAPTRVQQLGCTGQWLVFGTLLLIFLFGYALFSVPQIFELESGLALFWQPGPGNLHDAYWGVLLMGGLALLQVGMLIMRERPPSDLRKFALWSLLIGVTMMIVASIEGFHNDAIAGGIDAIEGAHVIYFFGMLFALAGVIACLYGIWRTRSMRWLVIVGVPFVIGVLFSIVMYSLSYASPPINLPDLTTFGLIAALAGAFAYSGIGPDTYDEAHPAAVAAGANGANGQPLVVAPR